MSLGGLFRSGQTSRDEDRFLYPSPTRIFPALALYGLAVPLAGIIAFDPSHFQDRWLAPVYFTLPLACFSMLKPKTPRARAAYLGYLCMTIAVAVFAIRGFAGFFPDITGKPERIHIPYPGLSRQLEANARGAGIKTNDLRGLPVISCSEDSYVAANILAAMPGTSYVTLKETARRPEILEGGGIFISSPDKKVPARFQALFPGSIEEVVSSSYIHSKALPPYNLNVLIIPPGDKRMAFNRMAASKYK